MGIWNTFLLSASFLISAGISIFLAFLWLSPPACDASHRSCRIWRRIVLSNSALSAAVTISTAVLRTTLSLQASVVLSMVAVLALESASGVPLKFVPLVLTLRGFGASTYQLLTYLWATLRSAPLCNVCALVVILTTLASQLTSTLLISSLGLESVVGDPVTAEIYIGKILDAEEWLDIEDTRPQYWFGGVREYPIFAESVNPVPPDPEIWKRDTGPTLRAFPPLRSSDERRLLESFGGYSRVWDTRFSCMPVDVLGSLSNSELLPYRVYIGGRLSVPLPSHMSVRRSVITGDPGGQVLEISKFNCSVAFDAIKNPEREWAITICAVKELSTPNNVSMESPLLGPDNFKSDGTPLQYLVINTTGIIVDWTANPSGHLDWEFTIKGPWTTGSAPITHGEPFPRNTTLSSAISYCATSLASAVVPVSMRRGRGEAEPVAGPTEDNRSQTSLNLQEITRLYAGVLNGDSSFERGVLDLAPQAGGGWTDRKFPDTLVNYELYSVNISVIHEGALLQKNGVDVSIGLCTRCSLDFLSTFRAHKDHAAVFQHILQSTGSLPLAMQTVWTVLAQMAYYDNMAQFDVHQNASIVSLRQVLIPVRNTGLVLVVIIIIVQNLAAASILALFLRRTRLSLLGNLWQGFGQLVASDIGGVASRTTVATDKEVLAHLEKEGLDDTPVSLIYDVHEKSARLMQMDRDQSSAKLRTFCRPEVP